MLQMNCFLGVAHPVRAAKVAEEDLSDSGGEERFFPKETAAERHQAIRWHIPCKGLTSGKRWVVNGTSPQGERG